MNRIFIGHVIELGFEEIKCNDVSRTECYAIAFLDAKEVIDENGDIRTLLLYDGEASYLQLNEFFFIRKVKESLPIVGRTIKLYFEKKQPKCKLHILAPEKILRERPIILGAKIGLLNVEEKERVLSCWNN